MQELCEIILEHFDELGTQEKIKNMFKELKSQLEETAIVQNSSLNKDMIETNKIYLNS